MPDTVNHFLTPYLISVIVSTGIGLIIGLEREFRKTGQNDHFAGIRTFPLVSLLGCIITFAARTFTHWIMVAGLVGFMIFIAITYVIRSSDGHSGITTEVSLIITFLLGAMTSQQLIKEALAATVITTTLLALKGPFHSFIVKITEEELFAFVKFIILCLLLFPFMPDIDYGPNGILNPREIGLVAVVVSSLSFLAYLLVKFKGTNKGIPLTALFGGLFSSTAVTWIFASRSQKSDPLQATLYSAGIILASAIMFLRVALLVLLFNRPLFTLLAAPCVIMALAGLTYGIVLIQRGKKAQVTTPVKLGNPMNILNALGFALLYVLTALLVFYGEKYFGSQGLLLSGLISGIADVDAITINISKLTAADHEPGLAVMVIVIATISNTLVKLGISLGKGSYEVKRKVSIGLCGIIATGLAYLAFSHLP